MRLSQREKRFWQPFFKTALDPLDKHEDDGGVWGVAAKVNGAGFFFPRRCR